jgi:hypothetical protein
MDYNYKQTNLSKAIFGGLFAGLIACGISELYNIIFRYTTNYQPADLMNVETLIFAPVFFCVIAGIIYFILTKFSKKGRLIYTILFILITISVSFSALNMHLTESVLLIHQFRELFISIVIIIGVTATFILPYVTKHDALID